MWGDDLKKFFTLIKSNITSNSHWAYKGQAGIAFPFFWRTERCEMNWYKNHMPNKSGNIILALVSTHFANGLDPIRQRFVKLWKLREGIQPMGNETLRNFVMYILLFYAERRLLFSVKYIWWMVHSITCSISVTLGSSMAWDLSLPAKLSTTCRVFN